eukprot:scaffold14697_cov128-Skeletonema_dohrnii-CCMP3373.AAC.1
MPGASTTQRYHRVLVYFMRYHDQVEYEFGHEFTREDLAAVVPNDLIRYFKFRLYDNPDADTDIEKPKCRSNVLKGWKKQSDEGKRDQYTHRPGQTKGGSTSWGPVQETPWAAMKGEAERRDMLRNALLEKMHRHILRLMRMPANRHAAADEELAIAAENRPTNDTVTNIYKRKFLWETVSELVRAGHNAHAACDMIYNVYGESLSVTKILDRLRADAKTGGNPQLCPRLL